MVGCLPSPNLFSSVVPGNVQFPNELFQFPDKSIRSLIVWNSFLSVHDARHANKHNTMKFLINYLFFMAGD